jgi:TetR/AcrR family transcriptional regulator, transcriptional repressor for nem operon
MARPRSFDPNAVVGAALQIFWSKGFERTSFDDITRATGVNKPSLYAAFGDKVALFGRALDSYHDMLLAHATMTLDGARTARAAVEAWLMSFLPACSGPAAGRGCLSVNATMPEAASIAPDITRRITAFNRKLEKRLAARIQKGIRDGDVAPEVDAGAAARLLLAAQTGLMVLAVRERRPANVTRATIRQALRLLDP